MNKFTPLFEPTISALLIEDPDSISHEQTISVSKLLSIIAENAQLILDNAGSVFGEKGAQRLMFQASYFDKSSLDQGARLQRFEIQGKDRDWIASRLSSIGEQTRSDSAKAEVVLNGSQSQIRLAIATYAFALHDFVVFVVDRAVKYEAETVQLIANALRARCTVFVVTEQSGIYLGQAGNASLYDQEAALASGDLTRVLEALFVPFQTRTLIGLLERTLNPEAEIYRGAPASGAEKILEYVTRCSSMPGYKRFAGKIHGIATSLALGGTGFLKALRSNPLNSWYGLEDARSQPDEDERVQAQGIQARFRYSDRLANVFAGQYRDVIWLLYLLSSFAVFAAVAGALNLWVDHHSSFWAFAELGTIAAIVALVTVSRVGRWHEQWLFHRALAERLRYSALASKALIGPVLDGQSLGSREHGMADPIGWIVRRTFVAAGPNKSIFRGSHVVEKDNDFAELKEILKDQQNYHERAAHEMHHVGHRLHVLTIWMFVMTTLAVISHFVVHASWLLIFTAALPALAAAMHGIKVQLEFDRLSISAEQVSESLLALLGELQEVTASSGDSGEIWLRSRSIIGRACEVLAGSASQWQAVVRHRQVGLPG